DTNRLEAEGWSISKRGEVAWSRGRRGEVARSIYRGSLVAWSRSDLSIGCLGASTSHSNSTGNYQPCVYPTPPAYSRRQLRPRVPISTTDPSADGDCNDLGAWHLSNNSHPTFRCYLCTL